MDELDNIPVFSYWVPAMNAGLHFCPGASSHAYQPGCNQFCKCPLTQTELKNRVTPCRDPGAFWVILPSLSCPWGPRQRMLCKFFGCGWTKKDFWVLIRWLSKSNWVSIKNSLSQDGNTRWPLELGGCELVSSLAQGVGVEVVEPSATNCHTVNSLERAACQRSAKSDKKPASPALVWLPAKCVDRQKCSDAWLQYHAMFSLVSILKFWNVFW